MVYPKNWIIDQLLNSYLNKYNWYMIDEIDKQKDELNIRHLSQYIVFVDYILMRHSFKHVFKKPNMTLWLSFIEMYLRILIM